MKHLPWYRDSAGYRRYSVRFSHIRSDAEPRGERQHFAALENLVGPWEAAFRNECSVPLETEASARGPHGSSLTLKRLSVSL